MVEIFKAHLVTSLQLAKVDFLPDFVELLEGPGIGSGIDVSS